MDLTSVLDVLAKEIGKGGGGSTEEPTVCFALLPVGLGLLWVGLRHLRRDKSRDTRSNLPGWRQRDKSRDTRSNLPSWRQRDKSRDTRSNLPSWRQRDILRNAWRKDGRSDPHGSERKVQTA